MTSKTTKPTKPAKGPKAQAKGKRKPKPAKPAKGAKAGKPAKAQAKTKTKPTKGPKARKGAKKGKDMKLFKRGRGRWGSKPKGNDQTKTKGPDTPGAIGFDAKGAKPVTNIAPKGGKDGSSTTTWAPKCEHIVHPDKPVMSIDGISIYATAWRDLEMHHVSRFCGTGVLLDLYGAHSKLSQASIYCPKGFEHLAAHTFAWPESISLDWPDGAAPRVRSGFWRALHDALLAQGKTELIVFCMGSHGRTGTALAAYAMANLGLPADVAVWCVRQKHCPNAVESFSQSEYLMDLGARLGVPVSQTAIVGSYSQRYNEDRALNMTAPAHKVSLETHGKLTEVKTAMGMTDEDFTDPFFNSDDKAANSGLFQPTPKPAPPLPNPTANGKAHHTNLDGGTGGIGTIDLRGQVDSEGWPEDYQDWTDSDWDRYIRADAARK